MLLPFLIFVPILFLMFRRQKKESEARSHLKKGDRIVSTSGLIGELLEMDERVAKVKLAPGVTVSMLSNTVSPFTTEGAKPPEAKALEAKSSGDKAPASAVDAKK
jgi:preprotein translocase subunit YajC